MTERIDWARFREMSSKDKATVHTENTFAELRDKDKPKDEFTPGPFGLKIEDEVNVDFETEK